jgi:hypothetical protein
LQVPKLQKEKRKTLKMTQTINSKKQHADQQNGPHFAHPHHNDHYEQAGVDRT